MNRSGTCVVSFAGIQVGIAWRGIRSLAILRFLYDGVEASWRKGKLNPRFRLTMNEPDDRIYLYRDDQLLYQGPDEGEAAGILLDWTVHDLADGCHIGPLFHAAALSYLGNGILLPGLSGSGKTTLAAWLSDRGYHYLTDELACVESGTFNLKGFYRPLHLKRPVPDVIMQGISLESETIAFSGKKIYQSERGLLVQANHINPNNLYHAPEVRLIIFPRYLPDVEICLRPLSKANACMHLMGSLVNARNLSGHGLTEMSRLARRIPAFSITYSNINQVMDKIGSLSTAGSFYKDSRD